jgi:hypothetical protein
MSSDDRDVDSESDSPSDDSDDAASREGGGEGGGEEHDTTEVVESRSSGGVVEAVGSTVDEEGGVSACSNVTQAMCVSIMRAISVMCCEYIFSSFSPSVLSAYFIGGGNQETLRSLSWIMYEHDCSVISYHNTRMRHTLT